MFEPTGKPRVFGLPPGADFPQALVRGLMRSFQGRPPQEVARVELIVNTRRMARRIRSLFDDGPALLLPRITLVTDLGETADLAHIPPAVPALRRRLEVTRLLSGLLDADPDLAPRSALFDLSDSLVSLMDEMHGEGVPPEALFDLDVSDHSKHWERSLAFLRIVEHFFDASRAEPDAETRQRQVIEGLAEKWSKAPPQHPVIIAGSTGSRGATMLLMEAVAKLPQGAIVLPGFDFDMPDSGWDDLADALSAEDHPQYRFRKLMDRLGLERRDVRVWGIESVPNPARNRIVSLAMRPAPVTDCWLAEGPKLTEGPDPVDFDAAMRDVTLLEAPSQREEALAIAMRLRQAAQEGRSAALITPDRMLTRQVTAALDRWNILPDDSAGMPLQLSAPGRFLRHVAALFHLDIGAETLLTLLLHPLTHSGSDRGEHLRLTRELELYIRRWGPPFPNAEFLRKWAAKRGDFAKGWAEWIIANILGNQSDGRAPLSEILDRHIAISEAIAAGPTATGSGALWEGKPGREARKLVDELTREAGAAADLGPRDYDALFGAVLSRGEIHDMAEPYPDILIWGTLEARVQGADLLILGGLNEGTWPEMPAPDPWMNRQMRLDSGLLLPERRIGLAAHDFQQAIGASEVWLTRSVRSDEAETVASRWVNRLCNLLNGLPDQGGRAALEAMRARGQHWLDMGAALEQPSESPRAKRPAPRPPVEARPKRLSVTEIKALIRDPYAIYARHVLRLNPLDPLMQQPDAALRGNVIHDILEAFLRDVMDDPEKLTLPHLIAVAEPLIERDVPWPDTAALWRARIARFAPDFLRDEAERQAHVTSASFEKDNKTEMQITDPPLTLVAKADRIDRDAAGDFRLYDYKTGAVPTPKEQLHFDVQLLLQTAMLELGGFAQLGPGHVAKAAYIGLGSKTGMFDAPLDEQPWQVTWQRFCTLIRRYQKAEQGFTARRALQKDKDSSVYDQLARFGEWDVTDMPEPEDLT